MGAREAGAGRGPAVPPVMADAGRLARRRHRRPDRPVRAHRYRHLPRTKFVVTSVLYNLFGSKYWGGNIEEIVKVFEYDRSKDLLKNCNCLNMSKIHFIGCESFYCRDSFLKSDFQ